MVPNDSARTTGTRNWPIRLIRWLAGCSEIEATAAAQAEPEQPLSELDKAIRERRKAWAAGTSGNTPGSDPQASQPTARPTHKWGLALSGGGIRSATFCLGLTGSLAKNKVLLRFDLLSTVSGGGYFGAMLGRLFSRATTTTQAEQIQSALGDDVSRWYLLWLRANGRYLIPRGAKDTAFALAVVLRNLVAIHVEIGLIALLLGLLLTGIDLYAWWALAQWGPSNITRFFDVVAHLSPYLPVTWLVSLLFVALAGVVSAAYWNVPWLRQNPVWVLGVSALAAGALVWLVLYLRGDPSAATQYRYVLCVGIAGLLAGWLAGVAVATGTYFASAHARGINSIDLREDWTRNRLTIFLTTLGRVIVFLLVAGLVDRVAWTIAFERTVIQTGASLAIAAAVLRAGMPLVSKLAPGSGSSGALLLFARLLGYALTFLLFAWWVSLAHKVVQTSLFVPTPSSGLTLDFDAALQTWLLLALPVVAYLLLTGRNFNFLNLSSLHAFYRARLARSYLGAANPLRFPGPGGKEPSMADPLACIAPVPQFQGTGFALSPVDKVTDEDNVPLTDYKPQSAGAPVHLINACINQTIDPRGGLFNQDRRGLPLTVASSGLIRVPGAGWKVMQGADGLSLAAWTAISGAAFAPGLGSLTRGGISALATFAGVRLGYWWRHQARESAIEAPPVASTPEPDARAGENKSLKGKFGSKSTAVLSEMTGSFAGGPKDDWFLSDGGHFENTGAYALLAERCELIVVADCGADPEFLFEDLENLVRKARIDLGAYITFQKPRTDTSLRDPHARTVRAKFGALQDLSSLNSSACLALAEVRYTGQDEPGVLVVVKPNMCAGLPVDLTNFWSQNRTFPQQTTVDQFFSEAQWESYFQLGRELGKCLSPALLARLASHSQTYFENDHQSAFEERAKSDSAPLHHKKPTASAVQGDESGSSRVPARSLLTAGAVGTTVGLGAVATVSIGAWQAIDGVRASYSKQVATERDALKDLTEKWAKVTDTAAQAPQDKPEEIAKRKAAVSELAAALVHTADTLCPSDEAKWYQKSTFSEMIFQTAQTSCATTFGSTMSPDSACATLLQMSSGKGAAEIPRCLIQPEGQRKEKEPPVPAGYWGYGYAASATRLLAMHPCDPRRKARMGATEWRTWLDGRGLSVACPEAPLAAAPTPAPVPAPAPAPTSAPPPPSPSPSNVCKDMTIYIQIYGPGQRELARALRPDWQALGASVPPIEDVQATASTAGRRSPSPVKQPVIRYPLVGSDTSAQKCAIEMHKHMPAGFAPPNGWAIEPLAAQLKPSSKAIEVWIPPWWFALTPDRPPPPVIQDKKQEARTK
ncbi:MULTISPECIES: patatin-like phospholipase family protein [unclassified Variovorax]|jgi:hypothetical protein|uniref:patatin-like phospholipase family protein n=1 Tax=unclassified Variovorax TaxID=663243 RepID=UPI000F7DF036|nr:MULTISPECIES: patatin-like phospholipase family protein [unclassified Variovorax]RSZ33780.1 hypothetical protein EJO70_27590 [Variovorax sp. 553]RSZ34223.1 hypothetical protein EJO71_27820 [Variovorax sp. 679]